MDLTELGLTKNEAKAYETLLKLGKTSAAHISKESRVPYGRIYDVLGSLEEKGLVKTIPEPTRMYFPSDPKALEEYVAKKKAALEEIESKVKEFKSIYKQHGEEQIQIVNEFKMGFYNVLVATSIAEEGLDITETNAVIFYEPVPSAIRRIQRSGRTARTHAGKVIVLMTKNTRDEAYHWVGHHKERKMTKILHDMQDKLASERQKGLSDFRK